jgi:hypothetical protein
MHAHGHKRDTCYSHLLCIRHQVPRIMHDDPMNPRCLLCVRRLTWTASRRGRHHFAHQQRTAAACTKRSFDCTAFQDAQNHGIGYMAAGGTSTRSMSARSLVFQRLTIQNTQSQQASLRRLGMQRHITSRSNAPGRSARTTSRLKRAQSIKTHN